MAPRLSDLFCRHIGHPRTLTDGDLLFLNALIDAIPSFYLDEMQQVHISIPTISWALIQHIYYQSISQRGDKCSSWKKWGGMVSMGRDDGTIYRSRFFCGPWHWMKAPSMIKRSWSWLCIVVWLGTGSRGYFWDSCEDFHQKGCKFIVLRRWKIQYFI